MAIIHNNKYKKIYKIEIMHNSNIPFANVILEIYNNIEDRLTTKNGIEYKVLGYENTSIIEDINVSEESNILQCFYNKIKQKEEYANSIDC